MKLPCYTESGDDRKVTEQTKRRMSRIVQRTRTTRRPAFTQREIENFGWCVLFGALIGGGIFIVVFLILNS